MIFGFHNSTSGSYSNRSSSYPSLLGNGILGTSTFGQLSLCEGFGQQNLSQCTFPSLRGLGSRVGRVTSLLPQTQTLLEGLRVSKSHSQSGSKFSQPEQIPNRRKREQAKSSQAQERQLTLSRRLILLSFSESASSLTDFMDGEKCVGSFASKSAWQ